MTAQQVVLDVNHALEELALGMQPPRGALSGFAGKLQAALAILAAPGAPDHESDQLKLLTRWRKLLASSLAHPTAIRHFAEVHTTSVDAERLWRHVQAAVATAAAAQAAQFTYPGLTGMAGLFECAKDSARLLGSEGGSPTWPSPDSGAARQIVAETCDALREAGWDETAARAWILRWLDDNGEPDSLGRVAMLDMRSREGFVGELRLYSLPRGPAPALVVDPGSALLPIGRTFLTTLEEAWRDASSPSLMWSLAVPTGTESAVLDGPSGSGAIRVAIEALGGDLPDSSCLVLARANRRGDLVHDIGQIGQKLLAAKRAGITRIVTGIGAPEISEPGLKVLSLPTVRQAVSFVTSREPYVRIDPRFPTFQDFFGMEAELSELVRAAGNSRVLVLHGLSGAGKTYLAAALAERLAAAQRRVVWLEQEGMGLPEFIAEAQRVFTDDQYIGSIIGESEAPDRHKLMRVVDALSQHGVALFIEDFQRARRSELIPFLERCVKYGEGSLVVLIDHEPPASWLGSQPVATYHVFGFNPDDASRYLRENSPVSWSADQLEVLYEKTEGHALALWAVCQWLEASNPVQEIVEGLLEFDAKGRGELERKLIRGVTETLSPVESDALHRASVFRVPFSRAVWPELGITTAVGRELETRGRLVATATGELRIHPLVRQYCYQAMRDPRPWHTAAGRFYLQSAAGGRSNGGKHADLLEAHYHFLRAGEHASSLTAAEMAIRTAHETEPVASNRMQALAPWVSKVPRSQLAGFPWLLIEQGRLLAAQGRESDARTAFLEAIESARDRQHHPDEPGTAPAEPDVLCLAHYRLGQLSLASAEALGALGELRQALKHTGADTRMRIRVMGKMIDCLTNIERYDEAEAAAVELLALARADRDELGSALTLYRTGRIARHRGRFKDAAELFDESAAMFAALRDDYRRAKSLSRAGIAMTHLGRLHDAEDRLSQAIALKKKIGDRHGLARDSDYLADVYLLQGRLEEARERYEDSLRRKEYTVGGDRYGQIKTYNNLARLYVLQGDLHNAATALRESARLIGLPRDAPMRQPARLNRRQRRRLEGVDGTRLTNTGDWHLARGEFREAAQAYQNAMPRLGKPALVVPYALSRVLLGMGMAAAAAGDYAGAIRHWAGVRLDDIGGAQDEQSALGLARAYGFQITEACALNHLARVCAQLGRLGQARELANAACSVTDRIGSAYLAATCLVTSGMIEEYAAMTGELAQGAVNSAEKLTSVRSRYDEAIASFDAIGAKGDRNETETRRRLWRLTVKLLTAYEEAGSSATTKLIMEPPLDEAAAFSELVTDLRPAAESALLRSVGMSKNLHSVTPPLAAHLARQMLHVVAPIAGRLGHPDWKATLEQRSFSYLLPVALATITQALDLARPERAALLDRIVTELSIAANSKEHYAIVSRRIGKDSRARVKILLDEIGLDRRNGSRWAVKQRTKSPLSIFKKQLAMNVPLRDILDISGVRIITETEEECREVRDIVMGLGDPFTGRGLLTEEVRDYIQLPKPSGYQSIHINRKFALDDGQSVVVEFQIRTSEMNLAAEVGLTGLGLSEGASHAKYKSSGPRYRARGPAVSERKLRPADPGSERHVAIVCRQDKLRLIGQELTSFGTLDVHSVNIGRPANAITGESLLILHLYLRARVKGASGHLDRLVHQVEEKVKRHCEQIYPEGERPPAETMLSNDEKSRLLLDLAASFPDSIYTVTPKGDVRRLPRGATVLDFAYAVHTEIGHRATRALVNDRMVSFSHELRPGDVVEIRTTRASEAGPSRDWLKIVRTTRARRRIKHWFVREAREIALEEGREGVRREMRKQSVPFSVATSERLARVAAECHELSADALYIAVGEKRRSAKSVVSHLLRDLAAAPDAARKSRGHGNRRG